MSSEVRLRELRDLLRDAETLCDDDFAEQIRTDIKNEFPNETQLGDPEQQP